jgi:hypothetical protein
MVLLYDSTLQKNRHTKFKDKWRGPFRVVKKAENSTFYLLEELDGTPLAGTTAGNRLKKFHSREIAEFLREGLGEDGSEEEEGSEEYGMGVDEAGERVMEEGIGEEDGELREDEDVR